MPVAAHELLEPVLALLRQPGFYEAEYEGLEAIVAAALNSGCWFAFVDDDSNDLLGWCAFFPLHDEVVPVIEAEGIEGLISGGWEHYCFDGPNLSIWLGGVAENAPAGTVRRLIRAAAGCFEGIERVCWSRTRADGSRRNLWFSYRGCL